MRKELHQLAAKEKSLRCLMRKYPSRFGKLSAQLSSLEHYAASSRVAFQPFNVAVRRNLLPRADTTLSARQKLLAQIAQKKQNIRFLEAQVRSETQAIRLLMSHRLSVLKTLSPLDKASLREYARLDKKIYYLSRSFNWRKQLCQDVFDGQALRNELLKARLNNTVLNNAFVQAGLNGLPPGLQTRKPLEASMPQHAPGIAPDAASALSTRMQNGMERFKQLRAGATDPGMLRDTLTFKPDPWRGLPFAQRLKHELTWQVQQGGFYYPAVLEPGISIRYLLNQRIVPSAGAAYRIGLGNSWRRVSLTPEGYTLRAGLEYAVTHNVAAYGSYEQAFIKKRAGNDDAGHVVPVPCLLLGVRLNAKLRLVAAFNLLSSLNPVNNTPFVFRFGI